MFGLIVVRRQDAAYMYQRENDNGGYDCVQPVSDLEQAVLRRAILPDGFDDTPPMSKLEAIHSKLLLTGGRLVFDETWCSKIAVHYELRECIDQFPQVNGYDLEIPSLAGMLKREGFSGRSFYVYVRNRLSDATRQALDGWTATEFVSVPLQKAMIEAFNSIIEGELIYDTVRFAGITLRPETNQLLAKNPQKEDLLRLNRLLLEDASLLKKSTVWYALRISFWHIQTAADIGGFTVRAALKTLRHPMFDQTHWHGYQRRYFCYPIWGIPKNGDFQVSGNVVMQRELPTPDELFTLAVSCVKDYGVDGSFFRRVVPHIRLTDVSHIISA